MGARGSGYGVAPPRIHAAAAPAPMSATATRAATHRRLLRATGVGAGISGCGSIRESSVMYRVDRREIQRAWTAHGVEYISPRRCSSMASGVQKRRFPYADQLGVNDS